MKIVIADDEPSNQKVTSIMCRRLGHDVRTASNGLELLEAIGRENADLVFLDIHMPMMDGLESAREIVRRWDPGQRPILIALSATADDRMWWDCLRAGMDGFLSKPVRMEALRETIDTWTDRRRHSVASSWSQQLGPWVPFPIPSCFRP